MANLPQELLQRIVLHLRPSVTDEATQDDRTKLKTLFNVSLASKILHQVARVALYHTLDLRDIYIAKLPLVLRTLIEHPSTCDLVRELYLTTWATQNDVDMHHDALKPPTAEILGLYPRVLGRIAVSSDLRGRIQAGLASGLEDAGLALLLCLCTRIRKLEFSAVFALGETLFKAVVAEARISLRADQATSEAGMLSKPCQLIDELAVAHWDTEDATSISELRAFLKLPALDTLRGHMLSCETDDPNLSFMKSTLRKCYLSWSRIDAGGLRLLLRACPSLEVLCVEWGSAVVGEVAIDYNEFGQHLQRHGSKLTALTLSDEETLLFDVGEQGAPLGNLSRMSSLKILDVSFLALFGQNEDDEDEEDSDDNANQESGDRTERMDKHYLTNTLPKTLRELRVTDNLGDIPVKAHDAQLRALMEDESFVELQTLCIHRSEPFLHDWSSSSWDDSESDQFCVVLKRRQKD